MEYKTKMSVALAVAVGMSASVFAKKVLFIDSYHEGYEWSDGVTEGVRAGVGQGAELKIFRMDTKRVSDEAHKQAKAAEAKALIESWIPDVIIAADDNAAKYIIAPFYKESDLPVVFCGINWDCSAYGFPTKNICGMEEVVLIKQLLSQVQKYAKGERLGYLSCDNETARKEATNYKSKYQVSMNEVYVKTVDEWKAAFIKMQDDADIIILDNNAGIEGWDKSEMKSFVLENTKVPTCTSFDWMTPYCLFGFTKLAVEQGSWAGTAAMEIMNGSKTPADLGVVQNKEGKVYVNLPIAAKLGAQIPLSTLKNAVVIKE